MLSGALLSALVSKSWEKISHAGTEEALVQSSSLADAEDDATARQCYPSCQLVGDENYGPQPRYANCIYDKQKGEVTLPRDDDDDGAKDAAVYRHCDKLENGIVEAVFYTNAKGFDFGEKVFVFPKDVDVDGQVANEKKDEILKALKISLRDGVSPRFMFMRNHNVG